MFESPIKLVVLILMVQLSLSMTGLALGAWWLRPLDKLHRYPAIFAVVLQLLACCFIVDLDVGLSRKMGPLIWSGYLLFLLGWVIHNFPVRMEPGFVRPTRFALLIRIYAVLLPHLFLLLLMVLVLAVRFSWDYRVLPEPIIRGWGETRRNFVMALSAILEFSMLSAACAWGMTIFAAVVGVVAYRRKSSRHGLDSYMLLSARLITISVIIRMISILVSLFVGAWLDPLGMAHFIQYLVDAAWELLFVRVFLGLVVPYLGGCLASAAIRNGDYLQAAATLIFMILPLSIAEILGAGMTVGLWGIAC